MSTQMQITPYAKNAKKHPSKQIKALGRAIQAFGFSPAIEVDKDGVIVSGHGRWQAAQELGMSEVKETARANKGDFYIPYIVLKDLTALEIKQKRLADNKLAETDVDMILAVEELKEIELEGGDVTLTGYDSDLLLEADEKDDIVPEDAPPVAQIGDVWLLGEHRVLCGDSTDINAVERLMDGKKADMVFTDPPYGVSYQSNMRTKTQKFDVLDNDQTIISDWIPWVHEHSKGFVFVWTTWKVLDQWLPLMAPFGKMSNMVVWHKPGGGIGDLKHTFSTDYELAMVFNRGAEITGKRIGSVWKLSKDFAGDYKHPTQKPVELPAEAITKTTNEGGLIMDAFLGSGSTLIAAEKTGRICYGMELDPKYVDVIIKRWEDYTGNKAVKV